MGTYTPLVEQLDTATILSEVDGGDTFVRTL
jgi:hypothetical protein